MNREAIFVAWGCNLGPCAQTFAQLPQALQAAGIAVLRLSRVYQSPAAEVSEPQPTYWNAVAEVGTDFEPQELMQALLAVEQQFGRLREYPRQARTLDLDLLAYGDREVDSPPLVLPHPRAHRRAFVLLPWAELAPGHQLQGRSLAAWIAELPAETVAVTRPMG